MKANFLIGLILCIAIVEASELPTLSETPSRFDLKSIAHNFGWELLGLALLVVYGMYFYVGRKKNIRIVNNWLAQYRPLLEKNFTSVGISGNYGLYMRESFDQFRLFCSGRRNCRGMLFDFKLKKRQDLFSLLLDFITPVDDVMTVDIPLDPETTKHFVFALCRKRDYKSVHSENMDLKNMAHPIAPQYTPELNKVSGNWVVISDNTEVPSSLLTPALINILKVPNCFLRLVHVSDYMPAPTDNRAHLGDYAIRIKAVLPTYDRMESLEEVMKFIMSICDVVSQVRLSPKAIAATEKVRAAIKEKEAKEENAKLQKRMKALKEQKIQEERERVKKLSPQAQAKFEAKLEKEERKKKEKRGVRVIR